MMRLSDQYETINRFRRKAPVDVEGLAEALGVDVHYAYLEDGISGMIERGALDVYMISINADDPPTRQRPTLPPPPRWQSLHASSPLNR